jgi:hypothetical protein
MAPRAAFRQGSDDKGERDRMTVFPGVCRVFAAAVRVIRRDIPFRLICIFFGH